MAQNRNQKREEEQALPPPAVTEADLVDMSRYANQAEAQHAIQNDRPPWVDYVNPDGTWHINQEYRGGVPDWWRDHSYNKAVRQYISEYDEAKRRLEELRNGGGYQPPRVESGYESPGGQASGGSGGNQWNTLYMPIYSSGSNSWRLPTVPTADVLRGAYNAPAGGSGGEQRNTLYVPIYSSGSNSWRPPIAPTTDILRGAYNAPPTAPTSPRGEGNAVNDRWGEGALNAPTANNSPREDKGDVTFVRWNGMYVPVGMEPRVTGAMPAPKQWYDRFGGWPMPRRPWTNW